MELAPWSGELILVLNPNKCGSLRVQREFGHAERGGGNRSLLHGGEGEGGGGSKEED